MRFDVVAVNLDTNRVRVMDRCKGKEDAEAIVCMAVIRRGVDSEIFAAVSEGSYQNGDKWSGRK